MCCTGYGQSSSSNDPLSQSQQVEEELKRLDETPIGKKISDLNRKWSATYSETERTVEQYREEFNELSRSSEYRNYQKKSQALAEKQDARWAAERKVMSEKARELYKTRHEELKKLVATDLTQARKLGLDVLSYPRVDGSTSTQPLSVIIASRILGTPYEWTNPEPTGSPYHNRLRGLDELYMRDLYEGSGKQSDREFTFATSLAMARAPKPGEERLAIMINSLLAASSSTHSAYVNLVERKCDLNLTARAPSAKETALAQKQGVKLKLQPIARDALVFIVNQQNRVKTISRRELVEIYKNTLTSWSALNGSSTAIFAFWREHNSGSRELFDALVTPGSPLPDPGFRYELFSNSMAGPFNQVSVNTNGIGYSVFYYEHYMALSRYTRTVAIDGVEPTANTIASGKYPYVCDVFAAYRGDQAPESPAMKLIGWLLSPEGQAVVRESGYVGIVK